MTKRDMTSEELLEHLYRGLSIEPDVQAETNDRDLRELAPGDDILQKEGCATPTSTTGQPANNLATASTDPLPTTTDATTVERR